MSTPLVLASTSRYRQELLARLGMPFQAVRPGFDEIPLPGLAPRPQVEAFARGKALAAAAHHPGAVVIGSDQGLVTPGGELLGKPGTVEAAVAQLAALRGERAELVTALCVLDRRGDSTSPPLLEATEIHGLYVRADLSDAELEAYVRRDLPLDCAGSFKIESLGIALFERIEGSDPTAIIGLPLIALTGLLRRLGLSPLAAAG